MQAGDLARVKENQESVYPDMGDWRIARLESQLRTFSQGQVVACLDNLSIAQRPSMNNLSRKHT